MWKLPGKYIWPGIRLEEKAYADKYVGFPDCSVDRIVPPVRLDNPIDVVVENYYEWNDDVLSTSKKDKDKHGYGLKNIKELCEKYQGSMEINIENAIFQLILSFLKI